MLQFLPDLTNPSPFPLALLNLELTSGPINDLTITIPEPVSLELLLFGLPPVLLVWVRRRKRSV